MRRATAGRPLKRLVPRALLAATVLAYVTPFVLFGFRNFDRYTLTGFDFGIHDQAVWLLSRGHDPFITISGSNYFGDHLSWVMFLVVPLYWLFPTAKILIVLQTLALGLAAIPAFLVAREKLRSEWLAAGVGMAYLANPYLWWINHEQFHPDVFAVPLVFLAIFFAMRRRWVGFFVAVVLMLLVKEDVPLLVFGLGILVALRYHRRIGVVTSVLAALWLFANFYFLLPVLSDTGSLATYISTHSERIPFGGLRGFLKTLVTRPWKIASQAFAGHRPWYYLQVFAPVAFLSFLSPWTLLLLAAPLVANGLSTYSYQYQIEHHYGTLVVPSLVIAAVFGIAHASRPWLRRTLVGVLLASAVLCAWLWGPLPGARHPGFWAGPPSAYTRSLDAALKLIPADAVLSAEYHLVTRLAHRTEIYEFPNPWYLHQWADRRTDGKSLPERAARVTYILVPRNQDQVSTKVFERLILDGEFRIAYERDGVVLLVRQAPPPDGVGS
jgi:uncharacterized membrane protein